MAQKGINKVTLIGHLGQDPEVRYMPNGNAVANFTLATGETWKDKDSGELRERTEWHRIAMFGKLAEIAGEFLKKGSQVYVEGRNQTRKYTDQSGIERYITEVVVDQRGTMQMMGARPQGNASPAPSQRSGHGPAPTNVPQYNEPPLDFEEDDVPY